ncbi:hypothetical protein NPIL_40051 [Nephila pilipes]|uniref:Uncharacterized protein n=1 Tax=Nephila pilipes TaxID=299642 RepID=A0A8X6Q199_NEPPI|nr:hypothetical protein NPIL_40051 [Nephila pilipes]
MKATMMSGFCGPHNKPSPGAGPLECQLASVGWSPHTPTTKSFGCFRTTGPEVRKMRNEVSYMLRILIMLWPRRGGIENKYRGQGVRAFFIPRRKEVLFSAEEFFERN